MLWESSKNQFGRPKKKGRQNFRIFLKISPPPLEKILDPPLLAHIGAEDAFRKILGWIRQNGCFKIYRRGPFGWPGGRKLEKRDSAPSSQGLEHPGRPKVPLFVVILYPFFLPDPIIIVYEFRQNSTWLVQEVEELVEFADKHREGKVDYEEFARLIAPRPLTCLRMPQPAGGGTKNQVNVNVNHPA